MNPATGTALKRKGFTAIEITAVATIIAILALILIPLLQERVEKTRVVAAKADLQQLMKAEMLVKADINQYVRLQDLDNTTAYEAPTDVTVLNSIDTPDLAVPHAYWNVEINDATRARIAETADTSNDAVWRGAYMSFNNYRTIDLLLDEQAGLFFWGSPVNGKAVAGGPIFLTSRDSEEDKYPVDPWGSPYLFFGPGKLDTVTLQNLFQAQAPVPVPSFPIQITNETDFKNSVIYSMGPDGQPGDNRVLNQQNLMRSGGLLGEQGSDDLHVQF